MIFVRSPHDIYYDIFSLIKLGFSAEYIETISPAERELYKSYYRMESESKSKGNVENVNAAKAVGLEMDDLL